MSALIVNHYEPRLSVTPERAALMARSWNKKLAKPIRGTRHCQLWERVAEGKTR